MDYAIAAKALGLPVPLSDEEFVKEQISKWQQKAIGIVKETFSKMRSSIDNKSATKAAKTGDTRQAQAIVNRQSLWDQQEAKMKGLITSAQATNEARDYLLHVLDAAKKGTEYKSKPPMLFLYLEALKEIRKDVPIDSDMFKELLDEAVIKDAVALGPAASTTPDGNGVEEIECFVTLQQAAAMVNRSKRTLEKHKATMPVPRISDGGGKADEWVWSELRPWLEKYSSRKLPERFPADQFRKD